MLSKPAPASAEVANGMAIGNRGRDLAHIVAAPGPRRQISGVAEYFALMFGPSTAILMRNRCAVRRVELPESGMEAGDVLRALSAHQHPVTV